MAEGVQPRLDDTTEFSKVHHAVEDVLTSLDKACCFRFQRRCKCRLRYLQVNVDVIGTVSLI